MKTKNYSLKNKEIESVINFKSLTKEKNILIQVFCGQGVDRLQSLLNTILKNLPHAICIGTTTDGEIENKNISTSNTIVSISTFKDTKIQTSYVYDENSFENGYNLAKNLVQEDSKLLILFVDGTTSNGENFLKGVEKYNNNIMICGGMAGDNGIFTQTYVSSQNRILKKGAVGVSLNSKTLRVFNDYKFNWSPIGIEHTIDKIEDNRVYSINGMTPVDFYSKYLGEDVAHALPATGIEFPLIIEKDGFPIARAVIAKHQDGSVSFAGNLKEGDKVKLGFGNAEMIMQNPTETLYEFTNIEVESFFLYSCMARRRYMPNFIQIEVEPFARIAPVAGFFTYAEFFHNKNKKRNLLLNQTFTVVALSETELKKDKCNFTKASKVNNKSEYARTVQALTHLIQQSTKDYDEQREILNKQKEYSTNLLKSQKQFLRHAVHETNTPLSVIMGNIELFELELGKNKYISNIEVAMKNLSSIYDDLSYLVKKDQIEYPEHEIDFKDFIRSRVDFFSQVAAKVKSKFIFKAPKEKMKLLFNESKLQRIIDNNLTNAIKYSYENEPIYVNLKKEDENFKFLISSHSRKIQDPKKVFKEYYREEKSKDGFGLGLNLVKRICDEENVEVYLESNEFFTSFAYVFKGEI